MCPRLLLTRAPLHPTCVCHQAHLLHYVISVRGGCRRRPAGGGAAQPSPSVVGRSLLIYAMVMVVLLPFF